MQNAMLTADMTFRSQGTMKTLLVVNMVSCVSESTRVALDMTQYDAAESS